MALIHPFTQANRRSTVALAAIFASRMMGLFMILPVLAISYTQYTDASPQLMGTALGIYGLCQALLQIPFGMVSDKMGRKPVILLGLSIFILGSVVAAMSQSIFGLIIGRGLQGAGAVGSVIIALVADLTPEDKRTQAMAIVGVSIGTSFGVAMILGPIINSFGGMSAIFWLTAVLGLLSMVVLLSFVPTPKDSHSHRDTDVLTEDLLATLKNPSLRRLDFGVFTLHAMLSALFLLLPKVMTTLGLPTEQHWHVYVPALIGALFIMVVGTYIGESQRRMKEVVCSSTALLILSLLGFWQLSSTGLITLTGLMIIFFGVFSLLEACLPSLVSKIANPSTKGTAMGIYSTSQFLGIFVGGSLGGQILAHYGPNGIFITCLTLVSLWFTAALSMAKPAYLSAQMLKVGITSRQAAEALSQHIGTFPGVFEAEIREDDGIAYLKIDSKITSLEAIASVIEVWQKKSQP